jgi:hypothetical protein
LTPDAMVLRQDKKAAQPGPGPSSAFMPRRHPRQLEAWICHQACMLFSINAALTRQFQATIKLFLDSLLNAQELLLRNFCSITASLMHAVNHCVQAKGCKECIFSFDVYLTPIVERSD